MLDRSVDPAHHNVIFQLSESALIGCLHLRAWLLILQVGLSALLGALLYLALTLAFALRIGHVFTDLLGFVYLLLCGVELANLADFYFVKSAAAPVRSIFLDCPGRLRLSCCPV